MVDMSQGYVLKVLVELLAWLLELPTVAAKLKRDAQQPVLLYALLCVRGLVMQKTSFTDECGTRLLTLLTSLHADSEPERRLFMAACVNAMREHAQGRAEDGRSLIFIFENMCSIVCPEKPEPEYRLTLNKVLRAFDPTAPPLLLTNRPSPRLQRALADCDAGGVHPRRDDEEPVLLSRGRPAHARCQEQDLSRPGPRRPH